MSGGAGTDRLRRVATWDDGGARRAVASLRATADLLPGWRRRLDDLDGRLGGAVWSGPAADRAAAVLGGLSDVTTAVGTWLDTSAGALQRMAGQVAPARELAARALALAASAGVELDDAGGPAGGLPAAAPATAPDQVAAVGLRATTALAACGLAEQALGHAAAAGVAAGDADAALGPLGVLGAAAPSGFGDLAALVSATGALPPAGAPPVGAGPTAVAAWWAGLGAGQRSRALQADPRRLGDLDGLPAGARDEANRRVLGEVLAGAGAGGRETAIAVAGELAALDRSGEPAQLEELDCARGTAAVAVGDLDTARDVAVLVPGVGTTVAGGLDEQVQRARALRSAAAVADPAAPVAAVAWLGYRAPGTVLAAMSGAAAEEGAPVLDRALRGLAAARAERDAGPARTTVVAHSYGTVVTDRAADEPGRLPADAVVALGSPGMESWGDLHAEVPELYGAVGGADPIGRSMWFGEPTDLPGSGFTPLPTTWGTGHSDYLDPRYPTLAAIGQVVAGTASG